MSLCKKCGATLSDEAKYCIVCGTAVTIEEAATESVTPTPSVAVKPKLAFWWERFVAWLIDVAIIGAITGVLGMLTTFSFQSALPNWPNWIPFFNINLNGVALFLYWTLMESIYGQSFGKMVMRIRITRLDRSPVGLGNAALESVGKAFLLPLDLLIGWFLYPKRRQRIFNYISETIVTRVA
jgi:uncharacterized RDD family membrane protein YckC